MNNTIHSLQKLANVMYIITKVLRILLIIGCVLLLLVGIVFTRLPDDSFVIKIDQTSQIKLSGKIVNDIIDSAKQDTFETVTEDGVTSIVTKTNDDVTLTTGNIGAYLLSYISYLAIGYLFLLYVGKLSDHIRKSETPFTDTCVSLLVKLGVCAIVFAIVPSMITSAVGNVLLGGAASSAQFSTDINITFIVLAVLYVMFILAVKYGVSIETKRSHEDDTYNSGDNSNS